MPMRGHRRLRSRCEGPCSGCPDCPEAPGPSTLEKLLCWPQNSVLSRHFDRCCPACGRMIDHEWYCNVCGVSCCSVVCFRRHRFYEHEIPGNTCHGSCSYGNPCRRELGHGSICFCAEARCPCIREGTGTAASKDEVPGKQFPPRFPPSAF